MESTNPIAPFTRTFTRKWDGFDHYHFICWAYAYYRRIKYRSESYHNGAAWPYKRWYATREEMYSTVVRLYHVGKRHHVLDLDGEEFWNRLDPPGYSTPSYAYSNKVHRRPKDYDDFYPLDGAHFRCKVPLHITEKKTLSEKEQQKREWREAKGFYRDKARHGWRHRGKPTRYGKQLCNREYRRHVRTVIQKGQYSKLTKVCPKNYFDPWRFD